MQLAYSHAVPADFVIEKEVECRQVFWMCGVLHVHVDIDNDPNPNPNPATQVCWSSLPRQKYHSVKVRHDTIAVFGDFDVVFRAVIVTVFMHVVQHCAAIC